MPDRHLLLVDDDEDFRDRLARLLSGLAELSVVEGEDALVDTLERLRPQGVFISVELPDTEGFVLFSKVKKTMRRVPVALVTSSVSPADMKLHEKLKVHADAYLDKRSLTDEALLEVLARRMGLEVATAPEEEAAPESEEAAPPEDVEGERREPAPPKREAPPRELEPWLAEVVDPETAALLSEIDEEGPLHPAEHPRSFEGEVSPERVAELEEEVARLGEELEQTRRDARSSPFSSDFSNLREVASKKDKTIRALESALSRRAGQLALVRDKFQELARRLREAREAREREAERARNHQDELAALRGRVERMLAERAEAEKGHQRDLEAATERLDEERRLHAETRRSLEAELTGLREQHQKTIQANDAAHGAALRKLEARLREDKLRLAEEVKAKYAARLEETERNLETSLATLHEEHETELAEIHRSHREALERTSAGAREALRQASEKSAAAVEEANRQRLEDRERTEEERARQLAEAEDRHQRELDALAKKHQAESERLSSELQSANAATERFVVEHAAKVEDLLKNLELERVRHHETRERYEKDLADIQSAHSKNLEKAEHDQFSALAAVSRKFREERARLIEVERQRGEEKLETLQREHAAQVELLKSQHRDEIAILEAAHEKALALKESEAKQSAGQEAEQAQQALREELERARRSHADELASLRRDHERETSRIQDGHIETLASKDREHEKMLREAVASARADATEKLERARQEASASLASVRAEYEEEIGSLEAAHESVVSRLEATARESLTAAEEERDGARRETDRLRAELAEAEAKHRSGSTVAEERHKTELRDLRADFQAKLDRLEEEKHFLQTSVEKLKRQSASELARTVDALTHEKKLHQGTRDRYERRIAELSARHGEGIRQVESDWMEKLELMEKSLNDRNEKALEKSRREAEARLEKERTQQREALGALARESEMEVAKLRQELERARSIEATYQAQSKELDAAKARIDGLTEELTEIRMRLAENDDALEEYRRRLADNDETIGSLKAVIDDFSRSVEGYARDREESEETISSLKAVIDDFYRSIGALKGGRPRN